MDKPSLQPNAVSGRATTQPPLVPQPSAIKSDAMKSRLLNRVVFTNSRVASMPSPKPPCGHSSSGNSGRTTSASRHIQSSHDRSLAGKDEEIREGQAVSGAKQAMAISSGDDSPDKSSLANDRSSRTLQHSVNEQMESDEETGNAEATVSGDEENKEDDDLHTDACLVDFPSENRPLQNQRLRRSLLKKSTAFTATSAIDGNILKTDDEYAGAGAGGVEQSVEMRAREIVALLFPHVFMSDKLKAGGLMQVAVGIAQGSSEFCYLRQQGDNPYKFDIGGVPENLTLERYATLSKHGITRYHGGEAELCSLPRFLNEFRNYHILIQKKVIYNFRIWKALYLWKNELKRNKLLIVARQLSKYAMVLDSSLGAMLIRSFSFCKDVSSLSFIDATNKCYHIEEFIDHQLRMQRSNLEVRRRTMDSLVQYLHVSGRNYTLKALERMPVVVTLKTLSKKKGRVVRLDENGNLVVESSTVIDQLTTESKSHCGTQEEKEEDTPFSYTEKSSIRGNCRRLSSMLRVCDFFLRDAFYDSVEMSLSKLYDHMLNVRKDVVLFASEQAASKECKDDESSSANCDKKSNGSYRNRLVPLFRAKVVLIAHEEQPNSYIYSLSPPPETVKESFRNMLIEGLNKGSYSKSLLSNHILLELLAPIGSEVQNISLEDRIFIERFNSVTKLVTSCNEILADEFNVVSEFLLKFDTLLRNYSANSNFAMTTNYKKLSVLNANALTEELMRLDSELGELKALNEIEEVGLIRLDFSEAIEQFEKVIFTCKKIYHTQIPKLYTAKGEEFYKEAFQCINLFSKPPSNLDDFVKMLSAYLSAMNSSYHFETAYNEILALRGVLEDFGLEVSGEVIEQSQTVSNANFQYNNLISAFGDQVEILTKTYTKDLTDRIKIVHQHLRDAEAFLQVESLLNPLSDESETLSTIKAHLYKLNVVREKNKELNHQQELMKLNLFSPGHTTIIYDTLNVVQTLWKEIETLRALRADLMSTLFMKCDVDDFIDMSKRCTKVLARIHIYSLHERLWKWLHSSIAEFNTLVPCVKMLQAEYLQDRHIAQIEEVLNYKLYNERDSMAVEGLVSIDVVKHREGLALVHTTALYEHNIEIKLKQMTTQYAKLEYELKSTKENKNVVHIANFLHVEEMLEDGVVAIAACLASTHSAPHRQGLLDLRSKLLVCSEVSTLLQMMQEGYSSLKNMFTSARTARQLSNYLKHFKRVDDLWRALQAFIKVSNVVAPLLMAEGINELLQEGLLAISEANDAIKLFIADLYLKWPKLLLIDEVAILDAIGMQDPGKTFQKFRPLLPGISDLIFDKNDIYSTIGVRSGLECFRLNKTSSSRSSVMEWLKQVDSGMTDKLTLDVRSFLEDGKDMLTEMTDGDPQSIEQARLLVMQIIFSDTLLRHTKSGSRSSSLRTQLQELKDQILAFSSISRNSTSSKYKRASLANTIILVMYQRDILSHLLNLSEGALKAAVSVTMKKKWSSINNSVKINHGQLSLQYGFKYKGFSQRLIITPLTDRCLLTLNIALQRGDTPILSGSSGSNKLGTIKALSAELGNELLMVDSHFIRSTSHLFNVLKAAVELGLWVALNHVESLSKELFSVLMSSVAQLKACIQDKKQKMVIGNTHIILPLKPHFATALIYHTDGMPFPYLPASARRTFRPINMTHPDRKVIIRTLIAAYIGTADLDLNKVCDRLDSIGTYLVYQKNLKKTFVFTLITHCIKMFDDVASQRGDNRKTIVKVFQILLRSLPYTFHQSMSTEDLSCLYDLFLDSVYDKELYTDSYKSNIGIKDLESSLETFLTTKLRSHVSSVVVVGAPGVGKSTLISSSIDRAILTYNDAIERRIAERINMRHIATEREEAVNDLFSQVPPYFTQLLDRKMVKFPDTFNPYASGITTGASTENSSLRSNILVTSAMSPGRQAMDDFISRIDSGGGVEIIHVDVSADTLSDLMPFATARAEELLKPVRFVWECTDMGHADPSLLYGVNILCVPRRPFDVDSFIENKIAQISKGSDHILLSLQNCAELYLVPSADNIAPDSLVDKFSLIENCLRLFESIFGSLFQEDDYSIIFDETLQKMFVFACIWNFGVCSPTSRSHYETWFLLHFNRMKTFEHGSLVKSRTINRKDAAVITTNTDYAQIPFASRQDVLGPLLSDIGSIFDFFLHREESLDSEVTMQWVTTKAELISSLNLRFERSFHSSIENMDHVYSRMAGQPLSNYNVFVPTPTGDALHFIQNCMVNSSIGGRLILMGSAGCGITSLMHQLSYFSSRSFSGCTFTSGLPPSAYSDMTAGHKDPSVKQPASVATLSWEQQGRWTCHTSDCSIEDMRKHVEASKKMASSMMVERNLETLGCIVIDDMNISDQKELIKSSCKEWLRQILETKNDYSIAKKRRIDYDQLYVLLSSHPSNSSRDTRFLRHFVTSYCHDEDITDVFATKIYAAFPSLNYDLCEDAAKLTKYVIENLRASKITISGLGNANNADSIFYEMLRICPISNSMDNLIFKIVSALRSLDLFVTNDFIRGWNRVLTDYVNNFPAAQAEFPEATTRALDGAIYKYSVFSEQIHCKPIALPGMVSKEEELIIGLCKNIPEAFITIKAPSFLKDEFFRKLYPRLLETDPHVMHFLNSSLDLQQSRTWKDVQKVAGNILGCNGQGFSSHTLLTSPSIDVTKGCVLLSCFVSNALCRHFLLASQESWTSVVNDISSLLLSMMTSPGGSILPEKTIIANIASMQRIVCHVFVCDESPMLADDWMTFQSLANYTHPLLLSKLDGATGVVNAVSSNPSTKKCISFFISKTSFVFSFASLTVESTSISCLSSVAHISSMLSVVSVSSTDTYSHPVFCDKQIQIVIDIMTEFVANELTKLGEITLATAVKSTSYRCGTFKAIELLLELQTDFGADSTIWLDAMKEAAVNYSLFARQKEVMAIVRRSTIYQGSKPRSHSPLSHDTPKTVKSDLSKSIEVRANTIYSVLYMRYLMLVSDITQLNGIDLLAGSIKLHLKLGYMLSPVVPLAMAGAYLSLKQPFHSLQTVVNFSKKFPETSEVRRVLSAVGIAFILHDFKSRRDRELLSDIAPVYIIDRTKTFSVLLKKQIHYHHFELDARAYDGCSEFLMSPVESCKDSEDDKLCGSDVENDPMAANLHDAETPLILIPQGSTAVADLLLIFLLNSGFRVTESDFYSKWSRTNKETDLLRDSEGHLSYQKIDKLNKEKFVSYKYACLEVEATWSLIVKVIDQMMHMLNLVLQAIDLVLRPKGLKEAAKSAPKTFSEYFVQDFLNEMCKLSRHNATHVNKEEQHSESSGIGKKGGVGSINHDVTIAKFKDNLGIILLQMITSLKHYLTEFEYISMLLIVTLQLHFETIREASSYTTRLIKLLKEGTGPVGYRYLESGKDVILSPRSVKTLRTLLDMTSLLTPIVYARSENNERRTEAAEIFHSLSTDIDRWSAWAGDPNTTRFPTVVSSNRQINLSWADKIIISFHLKPAILPHILLDAMADIGFKFHRGAAHDVLMSTGNVGASVLSKVRYTVDDPSVITMPIFRNVNQSQDVTVKFSVRMGEAKHFICSGGSIEMVKALLELFSKSGKSSEGLTRRDILRRTISRRRSFVVALKDDDNEDGEADREVSLITPFDACDSHFAVQLHTLSHSRNENFVLETDCSVIADAGSVVIFGDSGANHAYAAEFLVNVIEQKCLLVNSIPSTRISSELGNMLFIKCKYLLAVAHSIVLCRLHVLAFENCLIGDDSLWDAVHLLEDCVLSQLGGWSCLNFDASLPSGNNEATVLANILTFSSQAVADMLINCVYHPVSEGFLEFRLISSIFRHVFKAENAILDTDFLLFGRVRLPDDQDANSLNTFIDNLRQTYYSRDGDEKVSQLDLMGSTNSEIQTSFFNKVTHCFDNILSMNENMYSRRNLQSDLSKEVRVASLTLTHHLNNPISLQKNIIPRFHSAINRLEAMLPHVIELTHERVIASAAKNKLVTDLRKSNMGGAAKERRSSSIANRKSKRTSVATTDRSNILKIDKREYNPLWTLIYMEALTFNRSLRSVQSQLRALLSIDALEVTRQIFPKITEITNHLENGYVPLHWTWQTSEHHSNFNENYMTTETWARSMHERRKFITDWLDLGSPVNIKLHYMSAPLLLLQAMKELFMITNNIADSSAVHLAAEVHIKGSVDRPVDERDNDNKLIVSVPLAGIQLHNALLTRDGLRLTQQCYTNTALEEVSVILSATSVDKGSRREQYPCNLLFRQEFPHPFLDLCSDLNIAAEEVVYTVPINIGSAGRSSATQCDLNNVYMSSSSVLFES